MECQGRTDWGAHVWVVRSTYFTWAVPNIHYQNWEDTNGHVCSLYIRGNRQRGSTQSYVAKHWGDLPQTRFSHWAFEIILLRIWLGVCWQGLRPGGMWRAGSILLSLQIEKNRLEGEKWATGGTKRSLSDPGHCLLIKWEAKTFKVLNFMQRGLTHCDVCVKTRELSGLPTYKYEGFSM